MGAKRPKSLVTLNSTSKYGNVTEFHFFVSSGLSNSWNQTENVGFNFGKWVNLKRKIRQKLKNDFYGRLSEQKLKAKLLGRRGARSALKA